MQAAIIKVVYDRKTGKKLTEEVSEIIEVDEDKYYRPIVKLLGDSFLKEWNGGKSDE